MLENLIHVVPTTLDLLALFTCIGTIACRLWIISNKTDDAYSHGRETLQIRLWRLLTISIGVLTVTGTVELVMRTVEMSGQPLITSFSLLPKVLLETHYGNLWLARALAQAWLWACWWVGRRFLNSRAMPGLMLLAGALIALTRSASGHAADWGDFTLPELVDWLHLMLASVLGGGLLSLSIAFLPQMLERHDVQLKQTLIADIVSRFSNLAWISLAGVILSGVYNAWLEVGSFGALWETSYGRALIVKLLLLLVLIILGAFNRYISVPLIRWSAGGPLTARYHLHHLIIAPYLARFQGNPPARCLMRRLRQRVLVEVVLVIGILICTALLLHGVPARHISRSERGHAVSGQR